jgi:hypothetical protein
MLTFWQHGLTMNLHEYYASLRCSSFFNIFRLVLNREMLATPKNEKNAKIQKWQK